MTLRQKFIALQVDAVAEDGAFTGYGSVFGVTDAYSEQVMPGAFKDSLATWAAKGRMPAMLWSHSTNRPVGVWTKMEEDERGLKVEGRLVLGCTDGRDAYELMKAGAMTGLSIGFMPVETTRACDTNGDKCPGCVECIEQLNKVDLWEVSPVVFPACDEAQVEEVRSSPGAHKRELESALCDAGLSRRQAKAVLAGGIPALTQQRDAAKPEPAKQEPAAPSVKTDAALDAAIKAFAAALRP